MHVDCEKDLVVLAVTTLVLQLPGCGQQRPAGEEPSSNRKALVLSSNKEMANRTLHKIPQLNRRTPYQIPHNR